MHSRLLLGTWIRRFLLEHLITERNLSHNTLSLIHIWGWHLKCKEIVRVTGTMGNSSPKRPS